jgi:hypothetical protein
LGALEKLRSDGNGTSGNRIARSAGIEPSIYIIRPSIRERVYGGTKANERRILSQEAKMKYNLLNSVEIIDGVHIHLHQKSTMDGQLFLTTKNR